MKTSLPLIFALLVIFTSSGKAQNFTLWGMTNYDGAIGDGDLIKVSSAGAVTDMHNFGVGSDGQYPWGSLIRASNGLIYGMTGNGGTKYLGVIFRYNISTGVYTDLYDFGTTSSDGLFPLGSLIQANDGNLYGMTQSGGVNGGGIIFSYNISTNTYNKVYDFSLNNNPQGSLIQANNNLLYGMTQFGGIDTAGIIFSYNISNSTYTDLYDFKGGTSDGQNPLLGSLLQVNDSLLYGMTSGGGTNNGPHSGVIFCYNISTGKETVLHNFGTGTDGSYPEGSLIMASNNILYGMTSYGGVNTFYGIIFSYDISTGIYTDLHDFGTGTDGQDPFGAVLQASNGLLYGMTREGGTNSNGAIFSYNITSGIYNDIHNFSGNDGAYPYGSFIEVDPVYIQSSKESICNGDSVTLKANGATTYTWTPSTALSATTGDSVIATPTATTTYTIIGTTGGISDTVAVTITVTNSPISLNTPQPICNGQSTTLIVTGATTYTWAPAIGLSSTTGDSVIASPAVTTVYSVTGTGTDGCILTKADTLKVIAAPPLDILPSDTSFCNGQSAMLYIKGGGKNFNWQPSLGLNTDTGSSVIAGPTISTTYSVTGIDSFGCMASGSAIVEVGLAPNKPTITISVTGDTLISSATTDNQWNFDGSPVGGATDSIFVIKGHIKGWYSVTVTNEANGCSTTSDSTTSIHQLSAISYQLSIYPNPFDSHIFIKIYSPAQSVNDWELQITDLLARQVYSAQLLKYTNEIDLSNLPCDMYFITITNKTGRAVFPIVKQN